MTMKPFIYAIAGLALLVIQAHADLICYETPSQSLYVQLDDSGNHKFDMSPGSGAHTDRYAVTDAAIVSGGVTTSGNYTGIVRIGTAGAASPSDIRVAVLAFGWSGTAVIPPATDSGIPGKLSSWLLNALQTSGVFKTSALVNAPTGGGGGGSTPDTRDLVPPPHLLRLPSRADGTMMSPDRIRLSPGESDEYGFDCMTGNLLSGKAVVASFTDPDGLTGELSATKLGTNGQYCKFSVAATSDAVVGTKQYVSVDMTDSQGRGPKHLVAEVDVIAPHP